MSETSHNQFPSATTEQVKGWMAHDLELLRGGAEIVDGNFTPTQEQQEAMRLDMATELAGPTVTEHEVSVEQTVDGQDESEPMHMSQQEQVKSAAASALNKVLKPGAGASPESVSRAYREKTILPKGSDGEIATEAIKLFSGKNRDRLSPDQIKWFSLGLAVQANAAGNFKSAGEAKQ